MWFFVFERNYLFLLQNQQKDTISQDLITFTEISLDQNYKSSFMIRNIHKEVLLHEKPNCAIINFNHTEVGWPWNRFSMI